MSAHYDTEPPPTASATIHTTAGPIQISLFARQIPLACKNFLQHCLDGYYTGTTFHRVVPGFVIQGGDPTGTGSGGASIYEDPEFEFDPKDGEKVVFKDEIHSRLRFNRRGLLGMAKGEDGTYGSQFFVTLANAERELNKTCTMFGRVEGDGIYNVVKIAEAELVEGTDRPVYAVKITGCEVNELGPFEGILRRREKVAVAGNKADEAVKGKKKKKGKGAKTLLSFGVDEEGEGDEDISIVRPTKPKFNTKLVRDDENALGPKKSDKEGEPPNSKPSVTNREASKPPRRSSRSRSPKPSARRIPIRDPHTQLPLPDEEAPSRSPTPSHSSSPSPPPKQSLLSRTNAEIAALKASMRRDTASTHTEPSRKKSALESLIPETSIRGRKRRAPGGGTGNGISTSSHDNDALSMFNAFKARLENADDATASSKKPRRDKDSRQQKGASPSRPQQGNGAREEEQEEEEQLCDLHFITNCQSCRAWDVPENNKSLIDGNITDGKGRDEGEGGGGGGHEDNETDWMTHTLRFDRDTLGKDLSWKRSHQDTDDLVVIDPRQKEKEVIGSGGGGRKRERERRMKMEVEENEVLRGRK